MAICIKTFCFGYKSLRHAVFFTCKRCCTSSCQNSKVEIRTLCCDSFFCCIRQVLAITKVGDRDFLAHVSANASTTAPPRFQQELKLASVVQGRLSVNAITAVSVSLLPSTELSSKLACVISVRLSTSTITVTPFTTFVENHHGNLLPCSVACPALNAMKGTPARLS